MNKKKITKILFEVTIIALASLTAYTTFAAERAANNNETDRGDWQNTNKDILSLHEDPSINLTADYKKEGNYVAINWKSPSMYEEEGRNKENRFEYRVFVKEENSNQLYYESIPVKRDVHVLNVYPIAKDGQKGNKLKEWMDDLALKDSDSNKEYERDENGNYIAYNRGIIKKDENGNPAKSKANTQNNTKGSDNNTKNNNNNFYNYMYLDNNGPLITVDEKDIDAFNNDPDLKDSNGYKYDVIYEGTADRNCEKDLSETSEKEIEKFIDDGRGYLCGHDTFGLYSKNRSKLASKMKIAVFDDNSSGKYHSNVNIYDGNTKQKIDDYSGCVGHDKISAKQTGLLTNYPWNILKYKSTLDIPMSHSNKQFAFGNIWFKYEDNSFDKNTPIINNALDASNLNSLNPKYGSNNFYLTTWNNTAMIQTGHEVINKDEKQLTTPDEKKILANTLCYLSQITTTTNAEDHYCTDKAAPEVPKIKLINKNSICFERAKDRGTTYSYIVTAKNLNSDKPTLRSQNPETEKKLENEKGSKVNVKSETYGYLVYTDYNENTDLLHLVNGDNYNSNQISLENKKIKDLNIKIIKDEDFNSEFKFDKSLNGGEYVHIAAIDNAGNVSETANIKYTPKILDIESESKEIKQYDIVYADLTLDNVSEKNKSFEIHDIKNITNQHVIIEYDPKKLKYMGVTKVNSRMPLLDITNDADKGILTLNIAGEDEASLACKVNLLTLKFKANETAASDLNIATGIISDNNSDQNLTDEQLGKHSFNH